VLTEQKNDREAGSSCAGKNKNPPNRRYVHVEFAHRQFEENRTVPWRDAGLLHGG
jgi:hypothetical protein